MDQTTDAQGSNTSGIGQPVRRREDLRLVRGGGRYTADENLPGQVYAAMARSPHAHAGIRGIAKDQALAVPGVLAVLTGADCLADGLKPVPHKPWSPHPAETPLRNAGGGQGRRRAPRDRLRGPARRGGSGSRGAPGRAAHSR
jgi:CO/xanthine dehydrogenase Mo-binding subunit